MLTTLPSLKTRLGLIDSQYDTMLASAIQAVSARFDLETSRTLARTENIPQEFDPLDSEILARCYPIESVSKFEIKFNETDGWQELTGVQYLIRHSCLISLISKPSTLNLGTPTFGQPSTSRVTYSGGYVLPGTTPAPGQTPLPIEIENAATEQIAFWFINREKIGLKTSWPSGDYRQFATLDLLPSVSSILQKYSRVIL